MGYVLIINDIAINNILFITQTYSIWTLEKDYIENKIE